MDSDRKIRAVSLLKFSKLSLADIDQAGETDTELASGSDLYAVADDIISSLRLDCDLDPDECTTIFYVASAIALSIVSSTKCDHCRESLFATGHTEPLACDESSTGAAAAFVDSVNRGGLVKPTEFAIPLSTIAGAFAKRCDQPLL